MIAFPYTFEVQNQRFQPFLVETKLLNELVYFELIVRTSEFNIKASFTKKFETGTFYFQAIENQDLDVASHFITVNTQFQLFCRENNIGYEIGGRFRHYNLQNYAVELAYTVSGFSKNSLN
jgi:hypothetical protein